MIMDCNSRNGKISGFKARAKGKKRNVSSGRLKVMEFKQTLR
jgi:hypothetical protein